MGVTDWRVETWVPYKVCILAETAVFSALIFFFFDRLTGRTLQSFPAPWGQVFVAGLVLTASLSLYGIIRHRTVRGVLYERAGQIGFGILLLVYAIWTAALFGAPAFTFVGMLLSRGIAAILTVIKIDVLRGKQRRKAANRGPS